MKRKTVFRIVLWLIAANAAIAIVILLGGDLGDTGGKILATSLLATMGAILALICAPALSAGRLGVLPIVGMAASAAASVIFIIAMWSEGPEGFVKVGGTAVVIAVGAALVCVLSAWPGPGREWVRNSASALTAVGAAMIILAIWTEIGNEGYWRFFGVVMVLLAAASIATPVVNRMVEPETSQLVTRCPICGEQVTGRTGRAITCPNGHTFKVSLG